MRARLLDALAGSPNAMTTTNAIEIGSVVRRERRERRRERGGAGRDRHRHGEDVVGEQRDAGDLRRQQPEVVAGDDVRAAGASDRP